MRAKDYGWEPCEEKGCDGWSRLVFVGGKWRTSHVKQAPDGKWRWVAGDETGVEWTKGGAMARAHGAVMRAGEA